MNLILLIYLAGIADEIANSTLLGGIVLIMMVGFIKLFVAIEEIKIMPWKSNLPLIMGIILLSIYPFIPSKQTIYTMIAAQYGQQVLQSPITEKAIKVLDKKLDDILKENS